MSLVADDGRHYYCRYRGAILADIDQQSFYSKGATAFPQTPPNNRTELISAAMRRITTEYKEARISQLYSLEF